MNEQSKNIPQEVEFYIHDTKHTVRDSDVLPETTLNDYLRSKMYLTGTKYMCKEGGCGTCIVAATIKHPVTNTLQTLAINSCLVSIFSCNGWKIHTVEGIGNVREGYHPIQKALAQFNGTQCGFCSPGMVMNMFALYEKGNLKMEEIENSFGGNLCRCTGYRPILSAFKSLATDVTIENLGTLPDIEDFEYDEVCEREKQKKCRSICQQEKECDSEARCQLFYALNDSKWYKVYTVPEIFDIINKYPNDSYKLVGGNTARGVYKNMNLADIYIDINDVKELKQYTLNTFSLELGANVTLTAAMNIFKDVANRDDSYSYLLKMVNHIDLVATLPVRNIGTIAGNLSIKYKNRDFPSDLFLLLETVNASLSISSTFVTMKLAPRDYLDYDMRKKIIRKVILPPLDKNYIFESYKIMPRAQNAHAIVNAGFLLNLDKTQRVVSIRIVYGGISPTFIHAKNTEEFLKGKELFNNDVLQQAYAKLNDEIKPDYVLPDPKPEFRKKLAISLFYKFVLSIAPNVSAIYKSGGTRLIRPLSKGAQDYETTESMYPITEGIQKVEALAQTSGAAEYIMDKTDLPGQLYAAFVLTDAPAKSKITKVDPAKALTLEGVVAYVDKSDIVGLNSFLPPQTGYPFNEEIFCSGTIQYYYQPVGLILAKSQDLAEQGAELVSITYTKATKPPILTVRDVLADANEQGRIQHVQTIKPKTSPGTNVKTKITGIYEMGMQYHFHMETQCCSVVPTDDEGFTIYASTQWPDLCQTAGASAINIKASKLNMITKRCGGAYGAKISRNTLLTCAALVAANKTGKPVKLWLPYEVNMKIIGKRNPLYSKYEAAVDDKGLIQYINDTMYIDCGINSNESPYVMEINLFVSNYNSDTYTVDVNNVITDNHAATWTRAPGSCEGLGLIENIMDHLAAESGIDPLQLRITNSRDQNLIKFLNQFKEWADIDKRKSAVDDFNKKNRWMKRGLAVVPMVYNVLFEGFFNGQVAVYHGDGSVAISHGGIEIGQGVNTKAIQVVAKTLGIDMSLISCKPTDSLTSANNPTTGGSITSELVCMGLQKACNQLLERLQPVKPATGGWLEWVQAGYANGINMIVNDIIVSSDDLNNLVYGVAGAEVEVDILTGNHNILRADILEDVGLSFNPYIDIGQIEGAFIMGIGYYTSEEIIMDKQGKMWTTRTWNYKVPGVKDIPVDIRVQIPKNNPNNTSPFKSKVMAEPPICMSVVNMLAIKQAVKSARLDAKDKAWYLTNGPSTVESTFLNASNDFKDYKLN